MISVSGFRDDEIIELAHKRLSTIIIGGLACVIITIFVCPVWAGEDLHNLIAVNVERLANFLEGTCIYKKVGKQCVMPIKFMHKQLKKRKDGKKAKETIDRQKKMGKVAQKSNTLINCCPFLHFMCIHTCKIQQIYRI